MTLRTRLHELEEVVRSERSLRQLVENTLHDVMVPLTVLQGQVADLGESLVRGRAVDRNAVRGVLEELHYLASLVRNLRAAIRLEGGRPDQRYDAFSLGPVIERVVMRHATIAKERSVELDFAVPEEPVLTVGDETLIEQALSNVVHNAVRYNQAGGHVAVLLDAGDDRFSVRVIDDGPGVSDAELAQLADRTFRGGAARMRHPGGTGLGLAIAKDVAERHGFVLALRRSPAGGLDVGIEGPTAGVATTDRDANT